MRVLRKRVIVTMAMGAALAACGGGGILAVIGFVGSAGGDWQFGVPAATGFDQRDDCGVGKDELCFINIQIDGTRDLFGTTFNVQYRGNYVAGCPATLTPGGVINGDRISLPGCFNGRYDSINEAVSDTGDRAYFDSETPELATGVWVEIQTGARRFKFGPGAAERCELTTPRTPATIVVDEASLGDVPPRTTTTVSLTVGGQVWTGSFHGMSGMRLSNGGQVLELQRRDLPDVC